MRAVKSRNTTPEKLVRKIVRTVSPGYRLHRSDIPGEPDIAYISRKRAIFVHGCFWHGHNCARGSRIPKTNVEYWTAKIERNQKRDLRVRKQLAKLGWRTLILWECRLKNQDAVRRKLSEFLQT
jgi:DNA mismatch endonuclease (patch repair protein)